MAFLLSWYGLLCSLIVINVLLETGVSGKSNPLEAGDILKNLTFHNRHQCQRLCWYIELCERFSFYTENLEDAHDHPHNCVLHAGEEKDDDLLDGWMQKNASGDDLPSEHGCRNRTCGKKKVCIPLAMHVVKYDCIDLPADVDECASSPCQNRGNCVDGDRAYTCNCLPGYIGDHCETDIDECASNTCQNGRVCVDQVNAYTCNCPVGYTGSNCETDIDECASSPCKNNGSCVNQVNAYTCNCRAGYNGSNCETDINECASSPCQNGGSCVNQVNAYTCNCRAGYNGSNCETDVDECAADPCMNPRSCQYQVNGYDCYCPPGYTGENCKETWLNKTCAAESDCNNHPNTKCYSGQCLCADGFFFLLSNKSCVKDCTFPGNDTYLHYEGMDWKGHELDNIDNATAALCVLRCNELSDCRVFVFKKSQNACWLKKSYEKWTSNPEVSSYKRTCL